VIPVTDEAGRALPADPWNIQLTYRHRQPWWFDANSEPERWEVGADSDTEVASHLGNIDIVLVDLSATADPFSVLDGENADLGLVAEALFDPVTGQLAPELDEQLEPAGDRLLILSFVRLVPSGVASGSVSCWPGLRSRSCPMASGLRPATPPLWASPVTPAVRRTRTRLGVVWPWRR
jgi:hypothetical protein